MFQNKKHKTIIRILIGISLFFLLLTIFSALIYFYPKFFRSEATLSLEHVIDPQEPVEIKFSRPMISWAASGKIEISPGEEVDFLWEDFNRKLYLYPKGHWDLEKKYSIKINGLRNVIFLRTDARFSFETKKYPQMTDLYPKNEAKDVMIGMEDPILITFDKPIDDFKIKFTINPSVEMVYQVDPKIKRVRLLPKEELKKGEKYVLKIYIRHKVEPEESFQLISQTSFETNAPKPLDPKTNVTVRLEQARKGTTPQIKEGKYIDINLKAQIMVIFENGKALDSFLVSSGKRGMETPQGSFQVYNKHSRTWSSKYKLYMPYWMAFVSSGKFGIHELPEWPGGYKEGANHLGIPVSHGCVRLGVGPAEKVYNWAEIGTPVVIHT